MRVHTLLRIDTREIPEKPGEIRAFMPVRDELLRLPSTLEHYRKIGVARFFVVDNASSDGSKEFLLAQPDCHVFVTYNSFSESGHSVAWLNALLDEYGMNHWCLTVDADEWFVYPAYETKTLFELAAHLEQAGAQGVAAFLLDMYGSSTIAETHHVLERSLLELCPYFVGDYQWRRRFYIPGLQKPRFPEWDVIGGPRWRLFFPFLRRHYYLLEAVWQICYFTYVLTRIRLPLAPKRAPMLTKIPFVRWAPGTRYQHNHATTPIRLSGITGVLMHFKFLHDFVERVEIEAHLKEHWDDASEYERYLAKLKHNPSLSFHYPGSIAYTGSEQLVRLGLLREDRGWAQVRSSRSPGMAGEDQRCSGVTH